MRVSTVTGIVYSTTTITATPPPSIVTSTILITSSIEPTTTTTTEVVTVTPQAQASCDFWDEGWGWSFKVYNIANWASDKGSALHHEEKGCGALTGWTWTPASGGSLPKAAFNLPFFIKDGCVERAIVSAYGSKIACRGHGLLDRRDDQCAAENEQEKAERERAEEASRAAVALRSKSREAAALQKRSTTTTEGPLTITSTPAYTYPSMSSTAHSCMPMNWTGTNNILTFTWTFTETDITITSTVRSTSKPTGPVTITRIITITSSPSSSSTITRTSSSLLTSPNRSSQHPTKLNAQECYHNQIKLVEVFDEGNKQWFEEDIMQLLKGQSYSDDQCSHFIPPDFRRM
ncbi:hypothetical protein M436DRAFT_86610 [Aureobasidium namibiae CBS 147.97]|uniref:Uncharacterized protein n=1 Tax=Aureobasidium namibiae CBS 147.97 TaxID=1043004 RepID=A0A074W5R4_9PEZI